MPSPGNRALPVSEAAARADLAEISAALTPAGPRDIAVMAAKVIQVLGLPRTAGGGDPLEAGRCQDAWSDAVLWAFTDAGVPPDLVGLAHRRAVTGLRFPPKPAELVALIAPELSARKTARTRIAGALRLAALRGEIRR